MWAPVHSRALRCQPSMRLATTSRWTVKCGTVVQLVRVRSAIVRHALLTTEILGSATAAGSAVAGAPSRTRRSLAWTGRPRSDASAARSTPASRAIRRASGDAGGRGGRALGVCVRTSPGARIRAITLPTGASSPGLAVTATSVPSAGASSSTVTLSVSISISGSPFRSGSPSEATHQRGPCPGRLAEGRHDHVDGQRLQPGVATWSPWAGRRLRRWGLSFRFDYVSRVAGSGPPRRRGTASPRRAAPRRGSG